MSRGFLFRQSATSAARVPVTGEADDLVIVLQELELPPVVLIAGETKEKYQGIQGWRAGFCRQDKKALQGS